jgi:hypothetical protein
MRFIKVLVTPLAGSVVVYGATSMPAHAYLDPGTGSMILQVLLGGAAGLALAGKLYWHRFLTAIGVRSRKAGEASADGDVPAPATSRTDN